MVWIAGQTVTTDNVTNIAFTNIPQSFTHLQLRIFCQDNGGVAQGRTPVIEFNSDAGSNYTQHFFNGDGATTGSSGTTGSSCILAGFIAESGNANVFGSIVLDIFEYANTSKNKVTKSISGWDANGSGIAGFISSMWLNTSAISRLDIKQRQVKNGVFSINSRFDLYGITTSSVTGA